MAVPARVAANAPILARHPPLPAPILMNLTSSPPRPAPLPAPAPIVARPAPVPAMVPMEISSSPPLPAPPAMAAMAAIEIKGFLEKTNIIKPGVVACKCRSPEPE
jgi:hypothetical protein